MPCTQPTSSLVLPDMAETTTATSLPASTSRFTWRATVWIRSRSATEVPPNFITMRAILCPIVHVVARARGSFPASISGRGRRVQWRETRRNAAFAPPSSRLPGGRLHETHIAFKTDRADVVERAAVGDEGMDLREMADPHGCGPFELGRIGNQDDVTRIGDDRLGHLHLAIVEVEQRPVLVDGRRPDDRVIHLELADEIDGRLTDDAAVG